MKFNRILISFALLVSVSDLLAQSTPIQAITDSPARKEVGVFVGLGQNFQSGDMYVDCQGATFTGGTKFGYTLGLLYEQEILGTLSLGISASYNYIGLSSAFHEIESVDVDFQSNGIGLTEKANVRFNHSAEADIHNFAVSPYIKWSPFKFMFVRTGLALGTNFSTNIKHTKSLGQKTVRLSNGELAAITKVSKSEIIQDSEIPYLVSPQVYLQPALGFNFAFSKSVRFSPILEFSVPFANISSYSNNLKSNYWRILFELRIKVSSDDN